MTRAHQTVVIVKSLVYGLFIIVIISFFLKLPLITDSRLLILIFFLLSILLLIVTRVLILYSLYVNILAKNLFKKKILILGAGRSGQYFAQMITFENMYGAEIVGFVDDNVEAGTTVFKGLKVIGNSRELESLAENYKFDEIIICINSC